MKGLGRHFFTLAIFFSMGVHLCLAYAPVPENQAKERPLVKLARVSFIQEQKPKPKPVKPTPPKPQKRAKPVPPRPTPKPVPVAEPAPQMVQEEIAPQQPAIEEVEVAVVNEPIEDVAAESSFAVDTVEVERLLQEYLLLLRARIAEKLVYPAAARRLGLQGTVLLRVEVTRQGNLAGVVVLGEAAHSLLRTAALRTIESAGPFPPPPSSLPDGLAVDVPVWFSLAN